jgi:hypothetical protein
VAGSAVLKRRADVESGEDVRQVAPASVDE